MLAAISSGFCPNLPANSPIREPKDSISWRDFWSAVERSTLVAMPTRLSTNEVPTGPGSTNEILVKNKIGRDTVDSSFMIQTCVITA